MRVGLVAVAGILLLAGCASPPDATQASASAERPPGPDLFAVARHCVVYRLTTSVPATDLQPLVPAEWRFQVEGLPQVRLVVLRCIDNTTALLTVPMRAGQDSSDPPVEFVLQVFTNATDDWGRLGAPVVHGARVTVSDRVDALTVDTPQGRAASAGFRIRHDKAGHYGRHADYGGGSPVQRSWGDESAELSSGVDVDAVAFGPASVLAGAHPIPLNSGTWLAAFNSWYRAGPAPQP